MLICNKVKHPVTGNGNNLCDEFWKKKAEFSEMSLYYYWFLDIWVFLEAFSFAKVILSDSKKLGLEVGNSTCS